MFFALAQPSHVVQKFVLLGLAALGAFDFVIRARSPQAHPHALQIVILATLFSAIIKLATEIQFIQAAAALLLLHALGATYMDAQTWRRRIVLLLTLLLCLPIQPHIDAHLGLPLRLWTAQSVAPLLQALGVHNVTVGSIIVTENNVADVANACSGVRTLWYAVALWLCTRLLWPQGSIRRWLLAGALSVALAVGLNALRVALLVLALHHHAPALLADMAHASLGLLALAGVGGLNYWLCCRPSAAASLPAPMPFGYLSWGKYAALACLILSVALLPTPPKTQANASVLRTLVWPDVLHTEPVPLSKIERELVLGRGASVAEKRRFNYQGLHGSLLVVESQNWRAHHAPELCLLAQGAQLEQLTRITSDNGVFRVMSMQAGTQTAITWFQSGSRVLPDLSARWWSQLRHPAENWSLVTVVVDSPISPGAVLNLQRVVHSAIATSTPSPR